MKVSFSHHHDEADNIRTFFFKPERKLDYIAGQFIELTLKHDSPDDRGEKRWFTLSSSPNEKLLSVTTKQTSSRQSSYKEALWKLKPGYELHMSEAMGDFVLPKQLNTKIIFIAGGIGITPFHSIISQLYEPKERSNIKLLYAVNNENEIIFQETFNKASTSSTIIVSQPSSSWGGEQGRLDVEKIIGLGEPDKNTMIYISGPEPMVESLDKGLRKTGIKPSQLVLDFFPNYQAY